MRWRMSHKLAFGAGVVALAVAAGWVTLAGVPSLPVAQAADPAAPAAAMPVPVAVVESRQINRWAEFSGRLEAVERVEVRARVSGQVQTVHFREGGLVRQGDLLVSLDPAPFAAEVARAEAQVAAARARVAFTQRERERGEQLLSSGTISSRDHDQRANNYLEADANLRAAQAALETARLNLSYTKVRAPVSGRVGRAEVTQGNLVAAGANAPVLTNLVSVSPIYAAFDADEDTVRRALASLPDGGQGGGIAAIPVRLGENGTGKTVTGTLQMVGNTVDDRSGTVRLRAQFDNADGHLMPGQFARLSLGRAKSESALLISERAVGTDQDKKFVMVVGNANQLEWRQVTLGDLVDGLRVVRTGLAEGDRVVVGALQRVRPGLTVDPQLVGMNDVGQPQSVAQR